MLDPWRELGIDRGANPSEVTPCRSGLVGLTNYLRVNIPGLWYRSVKFGARKGRCFEAGETSLEKGSDLSKLFRERETMMAVLHLIECYTSLV